MKKLLVMLMAAVLLLCGAAMAEMPEARTDTLPEEFLGTWVCNVTSVDDKYTIERDQLISYYQNDELIFWMEYTYRDGRLYAQTNAGSEATFYIDTVGNLCVITYTPEGDEACLVLTRPVSNLPAIVSDVTVEDFYGEWRLHKAYMQGTLFDAAELGMSGNGFTINEDVIILTEDDEPDRTWLVPYSFAVDKLYFQASSDMYMYMTEDGMLCIGAPYTDEIYMLLVRTSEPPAPAPTFTFRGLTWGMTPEEVEAVEGQCFGEVANFSYTLSYGVLENLRVSKFHALMGYVFAEGALAGVDITIYDTEESYTEDAEYLVQALTQLYGDPLVGKEALPETLRQLNQFGDEHTYFHVWLPAEDTCIYLYRLDAAKRVFLGYYDISHDWLYHYTTTAPLDTTGL